MSDYIFRYIYYDWDDADITLSSGEMIYNKKLRYNGYINQMVWLTPNTFKSVKLDKASIKEVNFKKLHKLFRKLKIKGPVDSTIIYAEVLYENKITMYAYHKIVEVSSGVANNGNNMAAIQNEPIYYLNIPGNQSLMPFTKISRSSLVSLFGTNKGAAKKLLRQNQISIKSENSFIDALGLIEKNFY